MIAEQLNLPVYQVVAFVVRLDEFANAAEQRGQVNHFRPNEFGVALGMSAEDAQRIFDALVCEQWIEFGAIADFFQRNRDEEKDDQNERQQRSRNRKRARALLRKLEYLGVLDKTARLERELGLQELKDDDLTTLLTELRQRELSLGVTAVTSDTVTVTPEKITYIPARGLAASESYTVRFA